MGLFDELTSKNFELFAARNYRNHQCLSLADFHQDLDRFKYVLRLLRRYNDGGEVNVRLVLNHIIVIYNVFDISAANRMMFYRIDEDLHPIIRTFLIYLNFLPPETHPGKIDLKIAKELKTL